MLFLRLGTYVVLSALEVSWSLAETGGDETPFGDVDVELEAAFSLALAAMAAMEGGIET